MSQGPWDDEGVREPGRRDHEDSERGAGRWGDDDYERGPGLRPMERSGGVTAVAVFSFIIGGLGLLLGICLMVLFLAAAGEAGRQGMPGFPGFGAAVAIVVLMCVVLVLWAVGTIIAGVGTVNRRNWGRILTLVMTTLGGLLGIYFLLSTFVAMAQGNPMRRAGVAAPPGADAGFMLGLVIVIVAGALLIFHCIMSYVVLLNSRNAQEFE